MEVLREVAGGSTGSAEMPKMGEIWNAGSAEIPEVLEMPEALKYRKRWKCRKFRKRGKCWK